MTDQLTDERVRLVTVPRSLADDVAAYLAELGDTADEVAAHLQAAGVAGMPGSAFMHPLCRWLHQQLPDLGAQLTDRHVSVWGFLGDRPWQAARVPLPEPVAGFCDNFDGQMYTDLLLCEPLLPPVPHIEDVLDAPTVRIAGPPVAPGEEPTPGLAPLVPEPDTGGSEAPGCFTGHPGAGADPAPYIDAVALALQVRGVDLNRWHCITRHGSRLAGIWLSADAARVLAGPCVEAICVGWSETSGWGVSVTPADGGAAVLHWWSDVGVDACPAGWPIVPPPPAVASWVTCLLAAPVTVSSTPDVPTWRDAGTDSPVIEAWLAGYADAVGHQLAAADRRAAGLPEITAGGAPAAGHPHQEGS